MFDKLLMSNMVKHIDEFGSKMDNIQKKLAQKVATGEAGAGMVKVMMNGQREVLDVKIEKDIVNPDDVEMLEELVCAATNNALEKVQSMIGDEMTKLTGGINIANLIPGLGL